MTLLADPMPVVVEDTVTCEDLHHIMVDLPSPPYKGQWIADQLFRPIAGIVERSFDPPPILGLLLKIFPLLHESVRLALPFFTKSLLHLMSFPPEHRLDMYGHTARNHEQCPVRH